jgi:hypothetical protein
MNGEGNIGVIKCEAADIIIYHKPRGSNGRYVVWLRSPHTHDVSLRVRIWHHDSVWLSDKRIDSLYLVPGSSVADSTQCIVI